LIVFTCTCAVSRQLCLYYQMRCFMLLFYYFLSLNIAFFLNVDIPLMQCCFV